MMIDVLGGGPAGLVTAHFARRAGLPVRVHEAAAEVGGNCRTIRWGEFRFDTGAHRVHDRDPRVTAEIRALLGSDLIEVHAPSQILRDGKLIDFPLSPLDLMRKLDWGTLLRAGAEVIAQRLRGSAPGRSFGERAVRTYGATLARMFLLEYSAKLWGEDPHRLSPAVAGARLRGLDLRTFLIEALGGKRRKTAHLDGGFLYPRQGIGAICDRLEEAIGVHNIARHSRITDLVHRKGRLTSFVVNGTEKIPASTVVSTLPLTRTIQMLRPAAPQELLEIAGSMRFRHLVLGVFLVARERVTRNASIYFPGSEPFTRLYECKNRSADMAPADRTAIVLEVPCDRRGAYWSMDDGQLRTELLEPLVLSGLLRPEEILAFRSFRVPFAYPVLEVGFEEKASRIAEYLCSLENLHLLGRSARFQYAHIHDLFGMAGSAIETIARRQPARAAGRDPHRSPRLSVRTRLTGVA